jgi:two-component system chemotaxis sensor kinase CheA
MAVASASSAARSVDLTALDDDERLAASLKSVSQTVRVDIRKLDHLMNVVGELALARAGIQTVLDELKADRARIELARRLHREMRNLNRKLDELQSGILEVRMVPLGQIFDKLSRVVRKISREAGKEIRLVISGAETELDKLIVEELSDPLMHVIRNCIDHGIEPAAVRRAAGKPEVGTISIAAEQRGNHVAITIEDDGQGLDQQKLVRRAVERGFIDPDAAHGLTSIEIFNLIFLPGLSTKDVPDEISGRGVGMDVVKTNIARLSGIIDVDSTVAIGTRLTITLPITLAIIQALVIRVAGRTFAVPLNSVLEALMVTTGDVRRIERREMVTLRGQTLPLMRLDRTFRLSRRGSTPDRYFVVVVGMAQHRLGIMVDELLGQQDIVIKSIGRALEGIPGIAGATELGGQQTVLVLDVGALVEEALGETEVAA